jgi:hypothetical protein
MFYDIWATRVLQVQYTCMRFFGFGRLGQKNPSELLFNHLRFSRFWFEFAEIFGFKFIFVYSEYAQICLAYMVSMRSFILCILQIYSAQICLKLM